MDGTLVNPILKSTWRCTDAPANVSRDHGGNKEEKSGGDGPRIPRILRTWYLRVLDRAWQWAFASAAQE
jgi:hypothetical protein